MIWNAETLLAVAAIIGALFTGIAGLMKASQGEKDLSELKETIRAQGEKIEALEKENRELRDTISTLKDENDELREQNKVVNAVNAELRRLLDEKMRRNGRAD